MLRPREGLDAEHLAVCLRSTLVLEPAVEATNNVQLPRLPINKLQSFMVPDVRTTVDGLRDASRIQERVCRLADARAEQSAIKNQVPTTSA